MTKPELQDVGKFLRKLLLFLMIMFFVDRGVGTVIEYLYSKKPVGDIKTFSHSINNPKEDIQIYGSSRGVHGYVSSIFADTLGLSCFNSSRENSLILYHTTIFKWALKKHVPKIVILDVTPKELTWKSEENSRTILTAMLLPYVRRDSSYANLVRELYPRELYKARVSKLYAYNSLIMPILLGINFGDKSTKANTKEIVNGYLPYHGTRINRNVPPDYDFGEKEVDSSAKEMFEDFVKLALKNNIKLYVVTAPIFARFEETNSTRTMKAILKKYNVPYWDYSFDTAYIKKEYFHDYAHTNDKGARLYSSEIASRIKQDILKDSMQHLINQPGSLTTNKTLINTPENKNK